MDDISNCSDSKSDGDANKLNVPAEKPSNDKKRMNVFKNREKSKNYQDSDDCSIKSDDSHNKSKSREKDEDAESQARSAVKFKEQDDEMSQSSGIENSKSKNTDNSNQIQNASFE